ncbi:Flp pilus assembly complex ATPase component TadA [Geobacter sulfurreducens]|jgi:type II secretory ATPase GspE/PulE/Tfp pilus assembly ATPase PilB-like protein|uniref:PilB/PulE/GspE family ATPase n=1 Tax=Geobacter sulfurreducens (strain ATCC 51573 / DSM 12127 / PCA) TaxID=243231 RepID=Q749Y3_GEOSL|nr:ATPase, T2SS/T4P/T4SS family [Geobacter sulfurreducens]AAR35981.1 PilB/PulE/GspE family ATPase [Geobacter sulfurreducens PCA]ADI85359.1 PilB/PulE/GspE family ATPase [Geobacter sulfurreducens KN400]AJY68907.1 pilus assembly protein PilB [Geobacter sulfurreducens]QVW34433.1 Flp pilus assembly complex ATPase component TadA [Geobacter sulfurreducens]UAC03308.1 Flp pilus assembly complex ATPase component TadA [Geobacter sulfurreducens]
MSQKKVGEILIEHRLISEDQLREALELQKVFPDQPVGQLLCKLGFLSESELSYILEQTGKRQKLGDILIRERLVDEERLNQARVAAKRDGSTLERALRKLRLVEEEPLAKTIATQYDLSFVHINTLEIEPDLARCINPNYAQRQRIVPISRIGNTITLAMAYPIKLHELKELEQSIKSRIIPVIAMESEIIQAQQRLYKTAASAAHALTLDEADLEIAPGSIVDILSSGAGEDEPDIDDEVRTITERDSVIVKLVNKIIFDAHQNRASDIHIEPYPGKNDVIVRMRVDGSCKVYQRIPFKYKYAIPSRLKIMAELDIAEKRKPQDGKINFKKFGPLDLELRIATMPTAGGLEDVVIRLLNTGQAYSFDSLSLTDRNMRIFGESITKPYGLVLVVGPTGSGKTTTLHAAIARINRPEVKIWTAEDPVEITQKGLRQVQVNQRIGLTFAAALRSFLRLDPDVIMVGEMRDEETASIAVEASLTGHLVLSTLHTNSAPETVTRLLEMGLDPFSFSDSLLCVVAQRLARRLCEDCRELYRPDRKELSEIIEEYGEEQFAATGLLGNEVVLARPVGCTTCNQSGYRGRLGIHEVLEGTDTMKSLVKKKSDTEIIRRQAMADGMTTLRQDGILKVFQGLTDIHEVRKVCLK